ncbi:MAG: heat-shock protein [Aestuariivita sp.]|nr:heat-shock protein [Aestuariivita sp.]
MRHFDFKPLYRATVGFDQVAEIMDRALTSESSKTAYPPYNIEKMADDAYRISVAVAGFSADDITVEVKENTLFLAATKSETHETTNFLHRGIAARSFERRFQLADHIQVLSASHIDGMLHVDLKREVPEKLKARRIKISQSQEKLTAETIVN